MAQERTITSAPSDRAPRPGVAAVVAGGCAVVVAFEVALTLGAPFGAAALGGADTGRLSNELRVVTAAAAVLWTASALLALGRGGYRAAPLPRAVSWWGTWALVCLLGVGALMNFASSSSWERFGWGPFTLAMCALCVVLARSGQNDFRAVRA
jgi:hypothetical protein